jgi:hypothetical protein
VKSGWRLAALKTSRQIAPGDVQTRPARRLDGAAFLASLETSFIMQSGIHKAQWSSSSGI